MLKVEELAGGYDGKTVLKGLSFGIQRGEFLGIIGPNGSGKSTLLKLMSRALAPMEGTISFGGKDIFAMELNDYCRETAFVTSSGSNENFPFPVWEMVMMGRTPHLGRFEPETARDTDICRESLALTHTLELKEKGMDELSAGERQRVVIARALCQQPKLLFLDEPTAHLDIGHQIQILDLLQRLNTDKELTIVMVIHDLNLAAEYCSRLILLDDGKIFKEGTPEEVLTYQNIETVYKTVVVVKENPISAKPFVVLVSEKNALKRKEVNGKSKMKT